jgi:RNA polymerase sigma-70 factor (sigma-E family)
MRQPPDGTSADRGAAGPGPADTGAATSPAGLPSEGRLVTVEADPVTVAGLFAVHYAELVRLARHLLDQPGDAEDIVMDAFAGLELRWHRVRRRDDAFFYLRASVVNGTRSRLRRLRVARSKLHTQVERDAAPADQAAIVHLEHGIVRAAIRALPTRQREVVVLRYYANASEAEIAQILGISTGSVKTHASRGLRVIAAALEERPA